MTTRNDLPDLAQRLILRAAHKAPTALAERLREEWLADLSSRSGPVSRLRLAIGCCWATAVITRDFRVPQLAASGAAPALRPRLPSIPHDLPPLSRRTIALLVIAGVHVLVIYGFASGLALHVMESIPTVTHAVVFEDARPQRPPPPATPFTPQEPHLWDKDPLVPPVINYPRDPVPGPQTVPEGPADLGRPLPPRVAQRVVGGPGKGFPNTDDFYPAASRRLSETGAAILQVCVDSQGRLTADPTLTRSSGSRRLDDGALNLARAGSGHYRPTTEDGKPVGSCYAYRIRFEFNN